MTHTYGSNSFRGQLESPKANMLTVKADSIGKSLQSIYLSASFIIREIAESDVSGFIESLRHTIDPQKAVFFS
jgi:hypothetical protein